MNLPQNKAGIIWSLIVLLGGAVFAWDITTPLGQVPWLLYVPIMLLTLWIPHRGAAFIAAGAFSILIVVDHFLSPLGVGPRISIFNRSLGVTMLWLVAALAETWKRAEEALRKSEARLHAILDNSPMMIFLKDTEGRYLLSNRELEKFTHRSGKDIIGKTDIDLFPREQAATFRANDRRVLEAQTPMEFEEVAVHDDGPHTSIASKFPLFDGNGKVYAIGGIITDITDRKLMEQALKDSLDQLHALSARLQSIREEEQTRLSREVHDELGQSLTGLQLGLTWLDEKLDPHQRRLQEKVRALLAIASTTIESVQRLSSALRPVVLDDLGLIAAMEWQTRAFESHTGIHCTLASNIEKIDLDQMRATTVFRILQESLTNVARHAGASKVTVSFTQMERLLELVIQDNGKGIAKNVISDHRSLGLIGMQERAHACGGNVTVSCHPSGGAVVAAWIPLPRAEQA